MHSVCKKTFRRKLKGLVAQNLQSLNLFENDLGLAAAVNDDTWAI
jgi:hypothetical protein